MYIYKLLFICDKWCEKKKKIYYIPIIHWRLENAIVNLGFCTQTVLLSSFLLMKKCSL